MLNMLLEQKQEEYQMYEFMMGIVSFHFFDNIYKHLLF